MLGVVVAFFLIIGWTARNCLNGPDAVVRSEVAWSQHSWRDVSLALHQAGKGKLTDAPYWGPMTPAMAQRIGLEPKFIIDPNNLDGPKSDWLVGPRFAVDRGANIRIKGNPFWLYSNGNDFHVFIARGPDQMQQITEADAKLLEKNKNAPEVIEKTYDSTNGSVSNGDVYRIDPPEW